MLEGELFILSSMSYKLMMRLNPVVTFGLLVLLSLSSSHAATIIYNVNDRLSSGGALSGDGWTGQDLGNWVAGSYSGQIYTRNANDGDNRIQRINDANFSYSFDGSTSQVSLESSVRLSSNFMESGFFSSTEGDVLGWGLDFSNSNQYFIIANGSRTNLGAFKEWMLTARFAWIMI